METQNNTFFKIENEYVKVCDFNNTTQFEICGNLEHLLMKYHSAKNKIKILNRLDFSNYINVRAVLSQAHFGSKAEEMYIAKLNFDVIEKKLFDYLDTLKNPYFFILHPIYEYRGKLQTPTGYFKNIAFGIHNLHIACDYAFYLTKKTAKIN